MTVRSHAAVPVADAHLATQRLAEHMADHGLDPARTALGGVHVEHEGCSIGLTPENGVLRLDLAAPTVNMLYFIKEAAALHIAEIDSAAANSLSWSDAETLSLRPLNFQELVVLETRPVHQRLVRVTCECKDVSALWRDGLHVKLMLPERRDKAPAWPTVGPNGITQWPEGEDRLLVRYFTIRTADVASGKIDIDVVVHAGGKVSDWAVAAQRGDRIGVMGPGGGQVPRDAQRIILAGDETAMPAMARIVDEHPGLEGVIVVPADSRAEALQYLKPGRLRLEVLNPTSFASGVADAVAVLAQETAPDFGWFGGEFSSANAVRTVFKKVAKLPKGKHLSVSYWRSGTTSDARRED